MNYFSAERSAVRILPVCAGLVFSPMCFSQQIPPKLLQEDFQIMRHALEEAHGGIYRYTSKRDMDRAFDRAYATINQPMTDLEFWRLVAPVVAQIKCGHTSIWWPKDVQTQLSAATPLLPLDVRVLDNNLYIHRDYSSSGREIEGGEILSINGMPTKRIVARMGTVLTGDG